jgi:hypothetical protein
LQASIALFATGALAALALALTFALVLSGPRETRIRGRAGALSVWLWRNDATKPDH